MTRLTIPLRRDFEFSYVGERLGRTAPDGCEITTDVADRLVRLRLFSRLPDSDLDRATDPALDFTPQP